MTELQSFPELRVSLSNAPGMTLSSLITVTKPQ
jgi:hypothetical protein